jgi:hypothetical protein
MTLEQHKKKFQQMEPTNGLYLQAAKTLGLPTCSNLDHYLHLVESERAVRRLGLHRVWDALSDPDLSRDDLMQLVAFLIEQSRQRQETIEREGKVHELMYLSSPSSVLRMYCAAAEQWLESRVPR